MSVVEYEATGTLTEPVPYPANVEAAQAYLAGYGDMASFVPDELGGVVTGARWFLGDDGYSWSVTIAASRELTEGEREELSAWIRGQNSDGIGEAFEQQPFAELDEIDEDDDEGWCMISFDWASNKCELRKVGA